MCRFDEYAEGPECVDVVRWRADVNNAGICASIERTKELLAQAPACLVAHGNPDDYAKFGLLALTARAGVPLVDLVQACAQRRKGKFLTLVYQINEGMKRLLFVVEDRREASLCQFFAWFGKERSALITFVCSDMWKPYLNVIARHAPNALNILDRYHIAAKMNKAIDEVRAQETRALKRLAPGAQVILTHARWCLLKRPENLTGDQAIKLKDLLLYNLKSLRAYLLKEEFQPFWEYVSREYVSPAWAEKFMDQWCWKVMRSRPEPMKKIARMIRVHKPLILNWFSQPAMRSLSVPSKA